MASSPRLRGHLSKESSQAPHLATRLWLTAGSQQGQADNEEEARRAREQDWEQRLTAATIRTAPLGTDRHQQRYWWFSGAHPASYSCRQASYLLQSGQAPIGVCCSTCTGVGSAAGGHQVQAVSSSLRRHADDANFTHCAAATRQGWALTGTRVAFLIPQRCSWLAA